ncbi:MAG: hypothetical protein GTO22_27645 [Gemmatimonadales bacterium]|nr:hypothetical protein [Gemmatimonadales bacterium]
MTHHEVGGLSTRRPTVAADVAKQITLLSDRVRHLAFAGIAGVWAFKQGGPLTAILSFQLVVAGFFLVCCLATDLLEAALRVIVTARGGTLAVEDFETRQGWRYALRGSPERVLLLLKLGFLVMAYTWMLAHLYNLIILL